MSTDGSLSGCSTPSGSAATVSGPLEARHGRSSTEVPVPSVAYMSASQQPSTAGVVVPTGDPLSWGNGAVFPAVSRGPSDQLGGTDSRPAPHPSAGHNLPAGTVNDPHVPAGSDVVSHLDPTGMEVDSVDGDSVTIDPPADQEPGVHRPSSMALFREMARTTYPDCQQYGGGSDHGEYSTVGSLSRPSVWLGLRHPNTLMTEWDRQVSQWRDEGLSDRFSRVAVRSRPL